MKKLWITLLMLPVLLGLSTCARVNYVPDDHALLVEAVVAGDAETGRALAEERNLCIARGQLREAPVAIMTAFMLCPPAVRKDWISPVFAGGVEIISCEYGGVLVYYKLVLVSVEQRETD